MMHPGVPGREAEQVVPGIGCGLLGGPRRGPGRASQACVPAPTSDITRGCELATLGLTEPALGGVGVQRSRLAPSVRSLDTTFIAGAPKWASVTGESGRTRRTQDSKAKVLRLLRVDPAGGGSHSPATLPTAGTGGTRVLPAQGHSERLWEALWPLHSTLDLVQ